MIAEKHGNKAKFDLEDYHNRKLSLLQKYEAKIDKVKNGILKIVASSPWIKNRISVIIRSMIALKLNWDQNYLPQLMPLVSMAPRITGQLSSIAALLIRYRLLKVSKSVTRPTAS